MRRIHAKLLAAFLSIGLLGGCASKSYVVLLDNPDGSTGAVVIKGSKGEQVVDQSGHGAALDGSTRAAPVAAETIQRDFGSAMAARPILPERFLLYFESGGARLTEASAALLPKIIAAANRRPAVDVSIIGHTDTIGKAEVNEALALQRAQVIADLIKARGLKVHALSVESHGERNLLVATGDEVSEPRNRRVEISLR
ncbi:OmpA family protein [uncultured Azonexus sp.]|uniref:OmpA family protein n=1 Tax=uncultured Azonexus sp. TaxID=520307 RepID=UPI00261B5439|nr:OmpA family protein [uncultured Azonexus sp.]